MSERRAVSAQPGSSDTERAERVARYKEERRRQLQAQIAAKNVTSDQPSTRRYISRTRTTPGSDANQHTDVSSSSDSVRVRTTKASRLRAAAAESISTVKSGQDAGPSRNKTPVVNQEPSVSSATKPDISTSRFRITTAQENNVKSADESSRIRSTLDTDPLNSSRGNRVRKNLSGTVSDGKERSPLSMSASSDVSYDTATSRPEKDKSSKRKSNLNRARDTEEAPIDSNDDLSVRRRRRRVLNSNDVITSLNESGIASTGSTSASSRVSPQPSSRHPPTSTPTSRKSDLSVHMENARRGIGPSSADTANKNRTNARKLYSPATKSKSDTDKKRSSTIEVEENARSLSDKECKTRADTKKLTDEVKYRRSSVTDDKTHKSKRLSGEFDRSEKTKDNGHLNRKVLIDSDRSSRRVTVNSASKQYDVSKRMDELAALTTETLARVERLRQSQDSPKRDVLENKTKYQSKSAEKVLKSNKVTENVVNNTGDVNTVSNLPIIDLDYENHNGSYEETNKPSSILKKKSLDESVTNTPPPSVQPHHIQLPVSILKRKSSQDEPGPSANASNFATPVTFSPSVVDPTTSRKKQGILKKRCSLDESHVHRRRSYSPDVALIEGSNDYRPILKNQRRSSLEEIVRTRSPDLHIQGILKRKHSRGEEDFKDRSLGSPEPQSILKRKSGTSSSGSSGNSPHVSIATAVILAAAGGAEIVLDGNETVKPILKKKSFSDENPCMDSLTPEIPKPILKKKSSTETDDQDDRPKPILKASKSSSREDNYSSRDSNEDSPRIHSVLRNRSSHNSGESGSECETVRPILKQSSSRENSPRLRLSFCNDDNENLSRSSSPRSSDSLHRRPKPVRRSYTIGDADISSILSAKMSYEEEVSPVNEEIKKPSVFQMVLNFEKNKEMSSSTGAIPKRSSLKGSRNRGRFSTQPITFDELKATASLDAVQSFQTKEDDQSPTHLDLQLCSSSYREQNSSEELSHSVDLSISSSSQRSDSQTLDERNDSNLTCSLPNESGDSGIVSKMSVEFTTPPSDDDTSREDDASKSALEVCRSNSVSSKTSMFRQLEAQMKAMAEEAKAVKLARGNKGVQRYRNRKSTPCSESRFSTQPVTYDEVQEAARANIRIEKKDEDLAAAQDGVSSEANSEEPDPSKLSLAERVKLFNKKITEDKIPLAGGGPQAPRRRPRFKTQPVTDEEVETAKRINPLAASFCKPPDVDLLGGLSIRAVKDKMYEHAAKMLTSEVRGILKSKSAVSPVPTNSPSPESGVPKPIKTIFKKDSNGVHNSTSEDEGVSSEESTSESSETDETKPKIESNREKGSSSEKENAVMEKVNNRKNKDLDVNSETIREFENKSKVRRHLEEVQQMSSSTEGTPQTSDGESSGGREVKRIIGNEAVARRRQAAINRQKEKNSSYISKSKSQTSVQVRDSSHRASLGNRNAYFDEEATPFIRGGVRRSLTQPLRYPDEDNMSGGTIADRLAELKHNGNTDWKKRIAKNDDEFLHVNVRSKNLYNDTLSDKRPSSILDVQKNLETASQQWKKRIEPSDAINYSVAGRMHQDAKNISESMLSIVNGDKQKRTPKAHRFRSRNAELSTISTPTSPQKETSLSFKRSISAPGVANDQDNDNEWDTNVCKVQSRRVVVLHPDDETFTSFYESVTKNSKAQNEQLELTLDDLDSVTRQSGDLLVQKRTVRVQKRRGATHRNPLKALAARDDIQEEYTEVITGVAVRETRRMNVEKLTKHSSMAVQALAGLASKEDFTAIALKKNSAINNALLPYKDLMLLHIKGRRHVQTRLVEPVASSINKGDNYVLVTPTQVYNYVGMYSNVIEKNRGADVALHIQQKKDLGCKCNQVITIHEDKNTCSKAQLKAFWELLGSTPEQAVTGAGHPDEDEIYESAIMDTNMVYELEGDELVPVEEYWGTIPKIEMLSSSKVFVFDFGSEMYIWSGRNVSIETRKIANKLAKEMWDSGFNYSDCTVCPLNAVALLGNRKDALNKIDSLEKASSRPDWALIGKITQHGETILFREKFLDWPDFTRVIKVKTENEKSTDSSVIVKPCNAEELLNNKLPQPDLILEGSHVGRGLEYFNEENHQLHEITTLGVTMWQVEEYEYEELNKEEVGHFYSGNSYVVRWQYRITVTGRELSGKPSKHAMLGRDRCAYFCWQGKDASLNEKGAAALLTVELDHEKGPQVRVVQDAESPAFLNLFKGNMFVHNGSKGDSAKHDSHYRLYITRGDFENETQLTEVSCSMKQLRTRASMILINTKKGSIIVWHGSKSLKNTRHVAFTAAKRIQMHKYSQFNFNEFTNITITEIEEGEDNKEFSSALGAGGHQLYLSLSKSSLSYEHTPRMFHFTSTSGEFKATEVAPPQFSDKVNPYPFSQNDLYSASQPSLFLFDNEHELWLWQGWWPELDADLECNGERQCDQTGSGAVRWQNERKAAMQTTLDYRLGKKDKHIPAYLIWAGLEPLEFTNLFQTWIDRDDIAEINIKDGRKSGEILKIENELVRLTQSTYPLSQLLQRPLPEGVNPSHLEDYLSNEDFENLLEMTKSEFSKLPTWKQTNIKKDKGLF